MIYIWNYKLTQDIKGGLILNTNIENIIDETIKEIWQHEILEDYKNRWLIKEDTLKNAFYFHLRRKLGELFEKNNIRIFTEFTDYKFADTKFRPDIVIAEMDFERKSESFSEDISRCVAVIELKYKNKTTPATVILDDYEKLHRYAKELNLQCRLYMATIWEREDDETSWISMKTGWAKGVLTELNASYKRNSHDIRFYVCEHK